MPFALLALLLSAGAVAGSFYLSLEMNLKACTLCFYQRAFVCGLVGVLATGVLTFRDQGAKLCMVALPLAVAGLGVAGFHVWLGWTAWPRQGADWYLACPAGIEGIGTAPQQSFAAFALISAVLLIGAVGEVGASGRGGLALFTALVLGAAGSVGALAANPRMADPKPLPEKPLDTCQPTPRERV
jgi:disulfide bond formation protein DsbB